MRFLGFFAATIFLALSASATAQNTGQRLTDGPATFDYTTVTTSGPGNLSPGPPVGSGSVSMNFQLDGSPGDPSERQLLRGNWFYRVAGDTRERYPTNATSKSTSGNNYVLWEFPVYGLGAAVIPNVSVEMDFNLVGHNQNSATLSTGLCFTNNSSSNLQVQAFFAVELSLDATSGDDVFMPLAPGRLIHAVDGLVGLTDAVLSGSGASGSAMGNDNMLFGQLGDGTPHSFPDVNSGGGSFGGGAALLQFDHFLPAFSGQQPCIPLTLTITRVPEPTCLSLVGALLLVSAIRRGRRSGT